METIYEKEYKIGHPIFIQLFNTKRDILIDIVKRMVAHNPIASKVFDDQPFKIVKTLVDDEPETLTIVNWDKIEINPFGVFFQPEHGPKIRVVVFNEFFKLDM